MDIGDIILGDFLTIFDGSNEQSSQIEKLNGNLGSFGISSTGNSLFVKFDSDEYVNDKGFYASIHYGNPTAMIHISVLHSQMTCYGIENGQPISIPHSLPASAWMACLLSHNKK